MYILIYSNFLTEDRQKISYECITDFVTDKQPSIFRNKKYEVCVRSPASWVNLWHCLAAQSTI